MLHMLYISICMINVFAWDRYIHKSIRMYTYNMIDISVTVAVKYLKTVTPVGIVWGVNNSCCHGNYHTMFIYSIYLIP